MLKSLLVKSISGFLLISLLFVPYETHFTLYSDTRKGNRPSFIEAARPEQANALYDEFNDKLRNENIKVETGIFGAMMEVSLVNDGPVTIIIDSKNN